MAGQWTNVITIPTNLVMAGYFFYCDRCDTFAITDLCFFHALSIVKIKCQSRLLVNKEYTVKCWHYQKPQICVDQLFFVSRYVVYCCSIFLFKSNLLSLQRYKSDVFSSRKYAMTSWTGKISPTSQHAIILANYIDKIA